jgi:hypothetical protein
MATEPKTSVNIPAGPVMRPESRISYSILFYSILFYSILFYSILFYSILFYSILFYSILFYWHVQNATIPCRSQELLPFLSVMNVFLPPFSINYSTILSHFILSSITWSTSQSCCSQIHIYYLYNSYALRNSYCTVVLC